MAQSGSIVAQSVELNELDREQLLAYCRKLRYRNQAMVLFLKRMEVWCEYKEWIDVMRSRIDG